MRKYLVSITALLLILVLCSCSTTSNHAETPAPETPAPVSKYAVIAVKDDSKYKDIDSLISDGKSRTITFSAQGRCKLACGVYCELKDIVCDYSDENFDVLVCFEEDVPSTYTILATIDDMPIWIPESEHQSEIYAQLEKEVFG